jgi:flavin-binding protein dodecin
MSYDGRGKGQPIAFRGESPDSLDDAIRAAVHASGAEPGTRLVVTHIEVETIDDPNVGSYRVTLSAGGG